MNLYKYMFLVFLTITLACATISIDSSRQEFRRLCNTIGFKGNKISKQEFLSKVVDREAAEKIFNACDSNQDGYVTEDEARPARIERMKAQAIRLTEPRR